MSKRESQNLTKDQILQYHFPLSNNIQLLVIVFLDPKDSATELLPFIKDTTLLGSCRSFQVLLKKYQTVKITINTQSLSCIIRKV